MILLDRCKLAEEANDKRMYITTGRGGGKKWFQEAIRKSMQEPDEIFCYWGKDLIGTVAKEKGEETMSEHPLIKMIESLAKERGLQCWIAEERWIEPVELGVRLRFRTQDGIYCQYSLSKCDLERPFEHTGPFARSIIERVLHLISVESEKKSKERLEANMKNTNKIEYNHYSRNRNAVIVKVIFNPPATIVFWDDNTKTVVKTQNGEPFDPEKGLAMAIAKKHFGNEGNYFNQISKWTEKYEDPCSMVAKNMKQLSELAAEQTKSISEFVNDCRKLFNVPKASKPGDV